MQNYDFCMFFFVVTHPPNVQKIAKIKKIRRNQLILIKSCTFFEGQKLVFQLWVSKGLQKFTQFLRKISNFEKIRLSQNVQNTSKSIVV